MLDHKSMKYTIQHCFNNGNSKFDTAEYEHNIYANLYKSSEKNEFKRHDGEYYWPKSIKETIQWFPFITIMEHTANITKKNNRLISSLLKAFAMFELRLNDKEGRSDVVSISCINCKRETSLDSKTNSWVFDKIITKFVFHAILHHVGMSWIISSNK